MLCIKMPIDNLSNLERTFVQLFEENGYVESYEKNEHHADSPHHLYFIKDMFRETNEKKGMTESIQCGVKYSRVYSYIEFEIYLKCKYISEQTVKQTIHFFTDYYDELDYPEVKIIKDIRNLISKSEKMCDFIQLFCSTKYWIVDMSERCMICAYCNICNKQILQIQNVSSIELHNFPDYRKPITYDVDDFDKIYLSKHTCREW